MYRHRGNLTSHPRTPIFSYVKGYSNKEDLEKGGDKMKTKIFVLGAVVFALLGFSSIGFADFSIGVNINPPPIVINGQPEMAVIPGTYVYFDPDLSVDLFFYDGYWYRPYEGYWYRSAGYSGPWVFIDQGSVPDVFFSLPSDYRARVYRRIPYWELSRNWRTWHRNRYWNRVGWERGRGVGRERGHGVAPSFRGGERQHGVAPSFGGAQRQHGVAPSFGGAQRQNLGGNRAMGRQNFARSNQTGAHNQTGTQNMNRGGHAGQR